MQPCGLRDLTRPRGRRSFGLKAGRVADCARGTLAERGLKNIHATLWAAGFGVPSGAMVVWPQGRANCELRPRYLGPKGAKKHSYNLRAAGFGTPSVATVVWPQGRAICGLRPLHLGPKSSKKQSCSLVGGGIWRTLGGATVIWPQGRANCELRPRYLGPKGAKKHSYNLRAAGFGTPSVATVVWPQDQASCGMFPQNLSQKGAKKHSCNPVGCGIWRALGGDSHLASRPGKLRTASAVPLAQRGLKNIHATLWAAGFGASLGATVVWPQNQAICGLRPRHLGPKGAKKQSCNLAGCGIWRTLWGDGRLASRPGGLRATLAAPWPKGG